MVWSLVVEMVSYIVSMIGKEREEIRLKAKKSLAVGFFISKK
jgi:hypothetical protein